jgi:REP element-mobilizing transposase RayT
VVVPTTETLKQVLGTSTSTRSCSGVPNTPPRLDCVFAGYDPPLYFVTFNTSRRQKLLANEQTHQAFVQFAKQAELLGISIGRYVVMPDHLHLFVRGNVEFILSQWVRLLKRRLSKSISQSSPHWQDGFFDHLIRQAESYSEKWEYVRQNPVRAGLVLSPDDWPFQGEIVSLEAQ